MFWDDIVTEGFKQTEDDPIFKMDLSLEMIKKHPVQCFEVTNILDWMRESVEAGKEIPSLDGTQVFPPPAESFFLEFRRDFEYKNQSGSLIKGKLKSGILCLVVPFGDAMEELFKKGREEGYSDTPDIMDAILNDMDRLRVFSMKELIATGRYFFLLDSFSQLHGYPIAMNPVRIFTDRFLKRTIFTTCGEHDSEEAESIKSEMESMMSLMHMLLLFINTKNITIQIFRKPEERQNKARARKGKLPLATYKVLTIDPNKIHKELIPALGSSGTGISPRFHFCRGHFKQFSEEKPLLGKYAGTWFWTPQMRGKKSQGEVRKDYKVLPATNEEMK